MKKRFRLCLFFLLLAAFIGLTGVTSAQEIDLDNMSSEQLNALLQALTEKLGQAETPGSEESGAEVSVSSDPADSEEKEEPAQKEFPLQTNSSALSEKQAGTVKETKKYQIYENKKLVIGRMPDSMFIRKPTDSGGGEEEPVPEDPKTPEEVHNCPPGATYECYTDKWGWEHCGCGYG